MIKDVSYLSMAVVWIDKHCQVTAGHLSFVIFSVPGNIFVVIFRHPTDCAC